MANHEDPSRELWQALARIEKNQGEIFAEITVLRADLAMMNSRQNATINTVKKNPIESRVSSRHWQPAS